MLTTEEKNELSCLIERAVDSTIKYRHDVANELFALANQSSVFDDREALLSFVEQRCQKVEFSEDLAKLWRDTLTLSLQSGKHISIAIDNANMAAQEYQSRIINGQMR